ncbi:unnamed protein product, partial [marine sediment metagenome]
MSANRSAATPSPRRLRLVGIVALVVALALAITGIGARTHREHALKQKVDTDSVPTVTLIAPAAGESKQQLVLPSNVQAYYDAPIY